MRELDDTSSCGASYRKPQSNPLNDCLYWSFCPFSGRPYSGAFWL